MSSSRSASHLQVVSNLQRTANGFSFAEPKTPKSRRRIDLTTAAVAALRHHRTAQKAERLIAGAKWQEMDLVFPNERGRPIEAGNLMRRSFLPLLKQAG